MSRFLLATLVFTIVISVPALDLTTLPRSRSLDRITFFSRQDPCTFYVLGSSTCVSSSCPSLRNTSAVCCCCPVNYIICTSPALWCCGSINPAIAITATALMNSNSSTITDALSTIAVTQPTPPPFTPGLTPTPTAMTNTSSAQTPIPTIVPPVLSGFQNINITSDDRRIKYNPPKAWTKVTEVPKCVTRKHVRVTSTKGATFSFNFTGQAAFIRTVFSPTGGNVSLSINGGEPEIFNTYSPTTFCGVIPPEGLLKSNKSSADAENQVTGENVDGQTAIDGATYQQASAAKALVSDNIYLGIIVLVMSLVLLDTLQTPSL